MNLTPTSTGFGATVTGVDLGSAISDLDAGQIREALDRHGVLAFPAQDLDDDALATFANLWGELQVHPVAASLGGTDPIAVVFNDADHPPAAGGDSLFHTDYSFHYQIPDVAVLRSVTAPPVGGATTWADATSALRRLMATDGELAERLRKLYALHDPGPRFRHEMEVRMGSEMADRVVQQFGDGSLHPVIAAHPRTGTELLFVNAGFTRWIDGLSDDESDDLLQRLFGFFDEANQFEHRWAAGDVVVWDEHRTVHRGPNDFGTSRRELHRCTAGTSAPIHAGSSTTPQRKE